MSIFARLSRFSRQRVVGVVGGALLLTTVSAAQQPGTEAPSEAPRDANQVYALHAADGQRHGLLAETYAVVPGT